MLLTRPLLLTMLAGLAAVAVAADPPSTDGGDGAAESGAAPAAEPAPAEPARTERSGGEVYTNPDEPEEVIIIGDRFARWDRTRWFVQTQIGMPVPFLLYAEQNFQFEPIAMQIRASVACEKTWRRTARQFEVACLIEDIGLQFASWRQAEPRAQQILDELDAKLTSANIQLIVSDDGRLTNVDLEGISNERERERAIHEQARMLLMRAMAGFHMRLPPNGVIRQGQWVEYDSSMFEIPTIGAGGVPVNSMGGSFVIHQLDRYKGHNVVQSLGDGTVEIGQESSEADQRSYFKVHLDGVAIYNDEGIMTERVWALQGRATAGSFLADGRATPLYFHTGRLKQLLPDQKVDVGPTRLVARPGQTLPGVPDWVAID